MVSEAISSMMKVAVAKLGGQYPLRQISGMKGLVFLSLLIGALILFPLFAAAQTPTRRVLIITGSDPNFPGFSINTRKIVSTLRGGSQSRIEILYELQQGLVEGTPSPENDEELVSYLKQKYADNKLDLILSMAAPRMRILLEKDPALFANVPKIFYEFDSEREAINRSLGPNITGIWSNIDPSKTLDLALALHPDTRKVVVICGYGSRDNLRRERAEVEFRRYEKRVEFFYLVGNTIEELKGELAALDKRSVVIFLTFTLDRAGNRYTGQEVISMIAPTSNAPIYGYSDSLMGLGITGGNLLDFETLGARIGEMSLRVLAGERPQQIPQETAPTAMTVDWRELQRWGVSERSLPPGTVVRFRQPSFWESYKWHIISLLAVCVLQALLIAVLLFERRRRRRAIIELDKRVRFETLLSTLSADFTNLPPNKVDALVAQWLERLNDFHEDAAVLFFEVPKVDEELVSDSSTESPRALAAGEVKEDQWCLDQLRRGVTINLSNMPVTASTEKIAETPSADLKSLLAIPVTVQRTTYALALETTKSHRVWPKDLVPQFRLLGEIFAGALERKSAGEELQKTRTDLAHVARLTAMGEMAASIAHEVNQPLAAIATYGDACLLLLSGDSPNVDKSREAIDHIIKDSIRASEVVKRIRGLVKKTSHETTPQDLNQIIREMLAVTEGDLLSSSIQLRLHLDQDLPSVLGDGVEFQQVVLNLILNSIEAMSEVTDRGRELTIASSMNGGGQVLVTVQDSGVGLNSEQTKRVFDPFVTTKQSGLGLGLSISRSIVESHGGRLWAEPNHGLGAKFQFTLPTVVGGANGY